MEWHVQIGGNHNTLPSGKSVTIVSLSTSAGYEVRKQIIAKFLDDFLTALHSARANEQSLCWAVVESTHGSSADRRCEIDASVVVLI
jgi:hypothetical protein